MKMDLGVKSLQPIMLSLRKLFRFHYIISIIALIAGTIFTLFYLNGIISNSDPATDDVTTGFSDQFDTDTIKRVDQLKYSDEPVSPKLPTGRINPFGE